MMTAQQTDIMFRKRPTANTSGAATASNITEPNEDQILFQRFLRGDDSAFMQMFDRHTHRLYLYCMKFVNDHERAEDLVHDIWERVIRLRGTEQQAPLLPLLYRIARNLCLNNIRDAKAHASLDALPESRHPTTTIREMSQHEELVVQALPRLPIQQREVLILHSYSGYSFEEIAEMLGEQVGAVRTRAWRARSQLARLVAAMIEIDDAWMNNTNSTNEPHGSIEGIQEEEQ